MLADGVARDVTRNIYAGNTAFFRLGVDYDAPFRTTLAAKNALLIATAFPVGSFSISTRRRMSSSKPSSTLQRKCATAFST
jgi:hypothetical protein